MVKKLYKIAERKGIWTILLKQSAFFRPGGYSSCSCQGRSYLDCQAFSSFLKRKFLSVIFVTEQEKSHLFERELSYPHSGSAKLWNFLVAKGSNLTYEKKLYQALECEVIIIPFYLDPFWWTSTCWSLSSF